MKTIEDGSMHCRVDLETINIKLGIKNFSSHDIGCAFHRGVEFAQRWIPAEEELPKKAVCIDPDYCEYDFSDDVIVKTITGSFCVGFYSYRTSRWESTEFEDVVIDDVIGWRPLEYK